MNMKKILIALLLISTPAIASDHDAIVCMYKPTGERFNIVTMGNQDYIQWGSGEFVAVVTKFKKPYLTLTQYGSTAVFRMIWSTEDGKGYAKVESFDGKKSEGEVICAVF